MASKIPLDDDAAGVHGPERGNAWQPKRKEHPVIFSSTFTGVMRPPTNATPLEDLEDYLRHELMVQEEEEVDHFASSSDTESTPPSTPPSGVSDDDDPGYTSHGQDTHANARGNQRANRSYFDVPVVRNIRLRGPGLSIDTVPEQTEPSEVCSAADEDAEDWMEELKHASGSTQPGLPTDSQEPTEQSTTTTITAPPPPAKPTSGASSSIGSGGRPRAHSGGSGGDTASQDDDLTDPGSSFSPTDQEEHTVQEKLRRLSLSHNGSKPVWQPDSASAVCNLCASKFSLFRRRHHCRVCGLLVCGVCSKARLSVPVSIVVASPKGGGPPSGRRTRAQSSALPRPGSLSSASSAGSVESVGSAGSGGISPAAGSDRRVVRVCSSCVQGLVS